MLYFYFQKEQTLQSKADRKQGLGPGLTSAPPRSAADAGFLHAHPRPHPPGPALHQKRGWAPGGARTHSIDMLHASCQIQGGTNCKPPHYVTHHQEKSCQRNDGSAASYHLHLFTELHSLTKPEHKCTQKANMHKTDT